MSAGRKLKTSEGINIHRYHDSSSNRWIVKIMPGGQYISYNQGELIATVLGSCVAACVYDPFVKIGGMNHFMLPHDNEGLWDGASLALRYGNHAMEGLINDLMKSGAIRSRLECKVFGGANVGASGNVAAIGSKNATFIRSYAAKENLRIVASDLGGNKGRRILFDPHTGKSWRRFIQGGDVQEIAKRESKLSLAPPVLEKAKGSIELF
ncbi:hypothetical protein [Woodsholea maritima]|uniref:hypothetical protein n=1 Tax=Woodsholea maritima TaxID=240237 RepID=UPI00037465BE|nr:hypothetical protein [Woodsholea maritima]